jgi:hypothetical protein
MVNRLFFLFPRRKDEFISDYKGDPAQIYAPLLYSNQTCQIYDQCAANLIDCGGGKCSNKTSPNDAPATCYCDSPLVLILLTQGKYDCVCPSLTYYYSAGVCLPRPDTNQGIE